MTLYRTIVADPPWRYDREGSRGDVKSHYATMTPADIAAIPVHEWIADNAHLYLWVTNLKLAEAKPFEIIAAWGFRYVTMLTWHKVGGPRGIGLGYYFRGETEHCLFGVRGSLPIPADRRERNHLTAERTPHSTKPDRLWGNEAPEFAASQAEMGLAG